ncbi:hypothetical protein AX16_003392 [Volvariella volvacea WC 439]|nr:hypothetical protein AX16_003392 [Volvariella volvacea WC 439]
MIPRWLRTDTVYLAFLPQYPSFRGPFLKPFSSIPDPIEVQPNQWQLTSSVIHQWDQYEQLCYRIIHVLNSTESGYDVNVPPSPSEFGYAKTHRSSEIARRQATKSRNWFLVSFSALAYLMHGMANDPPKEYQELVRSDIVSAWIAHFRMSEVYIRGVERVDFSGEDKWLSMTPRASNIGDNEDISSNESRNAMEHPSRQVLNSTTTEQIWPAFFACRAEEIYQWWKALVIDNSESGLWVRERLTQVGTNWNSLFAKYDAGQIRHDAYINEWDFCYDFAPPSDPCAADEREVVRDDKTGAVRTHSSDSVDSMILSTLAIPSSPATSTENPPAELNSSSGTSAAQDNCFLTLYRRFGFFLPPIDFALPESIADNVVKTMMHSLGFSGHPLLIDAHAVALIAFFHFLCEIPIPQEFKTGLRLEDLHDLSKDHPRTIVDNIARKAAPLLQLLDYGEISPDYRGSTYEYLHPQPQGWSIVFNSATDVMHSYRLRMTDPKDIAREFLTLGIPFRTVCRLPETWSRI